MYICTSFQLWTVLVYNCTNRTLYTHLILKWLWKPSPQLFSYPCIMYNVCTPHISLDHCKAEHRVVRYKLKSCTAPIFVRFRLSNIPVLLNLPNVCNCTVPYAPRTVPAYAVRDPALTAEVVAPWGVTCIHCTNRIVRNRIFRILSMTSLV